MASPLDRLLKRIGRTPQAPAKFTSGFGGGAFGAVDAGYSSGAQGANQDYSFDKHGAALAVITSPAAYRCVDKRVQVVGAAGWRVVNQRTGDVLATHEDLDSLNPVARMVQRANEHHDTSLFALWEQSRSVAGETFFELVFNAVGMFSHVEWLNPLSVQIDSRGGLIYQYQYYAPGGQLVTYQVGDLIYDRMRGNLRTHVDGFSPAMAAIGSRSLDVVRNSARLLAAYFRNDAVPRALVRPTSATGPTGTELWPGVTVEQVRDAFRNQRGVDQRGGMMVLDRALDLTTFDLPNMGEWAELLHSLEPQIYTAFGVPRSIAGDADSTRYQASPQDKRVFNDTMREELLAIQSVMNSGVLANMPTAAGMRFEFDLSPFQSVDEERAASLREALQAGAITINEYRTETGMEELPGMDVYMVPAGVMLMRSADIEAGKQPVDLGVMQMHEDGPGVPDASPQPAPAQPAGDPVAELRAWKNYASRHGVRKAQEFRTQALDPLLRDGVIVALRTLADEGGTKADMLALFGYYMEVVGGNS